MTHVASDYSDSDLASARSWLDLTSREHVAGELEAILESLDSAVRAKGPVCWASGRCCQFEAFEHRLYSTGLEAARTWRMMRSAEPEPMSGGLPILQPLQSTCRYQVENRCTARSARPSGCRVFFCQRGTEAWQQDLYEQAMTSLRALHERTGAAYRFAEWRWMLGLLDAAASDGVSD